MSRNSNINIYPLLFEDPYGPYLENEVLTDACRDVGAKLLPLTNFMMECGGKCIGLTQSETTQPEYKAYEERIEQYGVRFRGVLTIETLDWLQHAAIKHISKDIHLRHVALHLKQRGDKGARSLNTPTLQKIYQSSGSSSQKVKIVVQCTKILPALYLTYGRLPNGLAVASEKRKRWYHVVTMDVSTYTESRKYLGRYRTLSILERLLEIDKHHRSARGLPELPRDERTPHWFAAMYKKYLANRAEARQRRVVWTAHDSDIGEGTAGEMKFGREHVLRHVPTQEILSLLATHADWILEEQQARVSRTQFLDMDVWADWVRTARRVRIDAQKEGVCWGCLDETEPDGPHPRNDEDIEMEEPAPRRPRPRRKAKPKKQTRPTASGSSSRAGTSAAQPLFQPEPDDDLAQGNVYDSDFSPPSSAPASDWDADESLPLREASRPDPEIVSAIPDALFYPPMLPDSSFVWRCPVGGCDYDLRLLELTDAHYEYLVPEDIEAFKRGGWQLSERWVQAAFMRLVSKHYSDHLDMLGILMWQEGKQTHVEWKNPKAHEPSSNRTRRVPVVRPESDEEIIKAEYEG